MGSFDPHPALKVAVPINPMVDGWRGDDWFHNGAFRQSTTCSYIYEQEATRKTTEVVVERLRRLRHVPAGRLGRRARASRGLEQLGFWHKLLAHPSYDAFWREQAVDRVLAARR